MQSRLKSLIPKYAILPLGLALLVNTCVYTGVGQLRRFLTFSSWETSFDKALPFVAPFVFFYILAFVQWGVSYILIARDSRELCYRFAISNIYAKIICLFFFLLFPTTLTRPEISGTDLCSRLVQLIYTIDAPVNLFPSIHCLVSWFCYTGIRGRKEVPAWYRAFSCIFACRYCFEKSRAKDCSTCNKGRL